MGKTARENLTEVGASHSRARGRKRGDEEGARSGEHAVLQYGYGLYVCHRRNEGRVAVGCARGCQEPLDG